MPGVGKLTIAKILADRLPATLIDNHLILNVAGRIWDWASPEFFVMVKEITAVVHNGLVSRPGNEGVIFTNALAEGIPEDEERLEVTRNLARTMGKPFIPVLIRCAEGENAARLVDPQRREKGKLTREEVLYDLISKYTMAHLTDHANALEIDTTDLSPEEAANRIAEHIRSCSSIEI